MDRANDPRYSFDADPSLDETIAQQGRGPITDLSILHGDFWPGQEPIEDFLAALHEWRGHTGRSLGDGLYPNLHGYEGMAPVPDSISRKALQSVLLRLG